MILFTKVKEYIFIILTATILLFATFSKTYSEENTFVVDNIKVQGAVDLNFSRDKYINKAFIDSFETLKSRILLSSDLNKIKSIKLSKIKTLIESFQINEESYRDNIYNANFKVFYNNNRTKKFLREKNISFSQPKNISAVFYPIFFVEDSMQNFDENYFYNQWSKIKIKNEVINYILPIEDLEDILKIKEMKDNIENLNVDNLVNKYDIKNYVFALMDYQKGKLNIYLNTNFNNNKMAKNVTYNIENINKKSNLEPVLKDLKIKITDIWKLENIINFSLPLNLIIKFEHKNIKNLDDLKRALNKVSIIDSYSLQELDIDNSYFKIKYYGDPKRLKKELSTLGYKLENDGRNWRLYANG